MSQQIKTQIEYYLSEKNLQKDSFFRDMIQKEGFLTLDVLLNCNNLKKLNANKDLMISSIKDSQIVEMTSDMKAIKRIKELDLPVVKKVKTEDQQELQEIKNLDPLILIISGENKDTKWRDLQTKFQEKYNLKTFYFRFNQGEGHIVVERSKASDLKDQIQSEGVDCDNVNYKIEIAQGENLKLFWSKHGDHYNMCLKNLSKSKQETKQKKPIIFQNKKFGDQQQLKNIFKSIIQRTNNGDKILEPYQKMLQDILKYHDNYESKIKDFSHFTVEQHPTHVDSRCFFVIKNDGTKEDFSVVKCVESLISKQ